MRKMVNVAHLNLNLVSVNTICTSESVIKPVIEDSIFFVNINTGRLFLYIFIIVELI